MRILVLAISILIASCSSTPTYNPSVYPYEFNEELVKDKPIKKVVLASANMGAPPPSYLASTHPTYLIYTLWNKRQGFQKKLGCLTASFTLQEHNMEHNSSVFVAFLDTKKPLIRCGGTASCVEMGFSADGVLEVLVERWVCL